MSEIASTETNQTTNRTNGMLTSITHADFIGIGGCGMSGLARMLHSIGIACSGSDATPTALTESLQREGMTLRTLQDGSGIPEQTNLVVASAAIPSDHPERLAAEARGIRVLSYSEALGLVQADRTAICIAGTHGKSTTAAMLCHVMTECGLDPGFIIGANCNQIGTSRPGASVIPGTGPMAGEPGMLICEACEFNRSFHHHCPTVALINNVEEDHLDIYGSLEAIIEAFGDFAKKIPPAEEGGSLLIAHDNAHRQHITPPLHCHVSTFGWNPEADYQVIMDREVPRVGILRDGMWLVQWTNQMVGGHNALNAAAAVILAHQLGAEWEEAAEAMARFQGLDRRMQKMGTCPVHDGEVVVYDDYAHHPTEIEQTLKALRTAEDPERLVCVFQPHQHSRTRFLLDSFAESFASADEVIVPHIYFVRDSEVEKHKVSAVDLVDRLQERGVVARHIDTFDAIVAHLREHLQEGDLLVIMGAGPVWTIGRDLLEPST
ncbi:MAG: UDP-N-acetylmuramate--L-alanine ligase [Phycisphaerales bacterium]|nr:UDP-N-acetylmuramate--L-alanine ligase [Phycisphaerales bacterium]